MNSNIGRLNFKAMFWKETTEIKRSMKLITLLVIVSINIFQFITIDNIVNDKNIDYILKIELISSSIIYIPLLVMIFLGHTLIDKFIKEEKTSKTIWVLLSSGMDKTIIWSSKVLVASVYSFIICVITLIINIIFIKSYYGFWVNFSFNILILVLITMPILSIGIICIMSCLYWYFSKVELLSIIFPIFSLIGIWNISSLLISKQPTNNLLIITFLIGVILITFSFFIIKNISKEVICKI